MYGPAHNSSPIGVGGRGGGHNGKSSKWLRQDPTGDGLDVSVQLRFGKRSRFISNSVALPGLIGRKHIVWLREPEAGESYMLGLEIGLKAALRAGAVHKTNFRAFEVFKTLHRRNLRHQHGTRFVVNAGSRQKRAAKILLDDIRAGQEENIVLLLSDCIEISSCVIASKFEPP